MLRVYTQTNLRRDLNLGSPLEIQNSDVNDIVLFTLLTAPGTLSQPVHEDVYVFRPFSWRLAEWGARIFKLYSSLT